ncbi:MetQ/NlpA family ABC transporter substrate-binding protein [Alteribacter natronophilus]|uniref:MetQ/NlpA family ABC transporter substrate-binding protein n=1 Tax=Alteribacter natronophilus TaxID=2583810 RepID=UPI00110E38C3|nr:MetQ/NlpA family ABC transporter substrate-binding protein [Alteribacter natronophilus]TMW72460.1 MetQ/NlpA family ABC transporter substrate-binding protein [Alteribacter natronophilus]
MKKTLTFGTFAATAGILAACGGGNGGDGDDSTLVVGATNIPHSEILEFAEPLLEEEGIDLQIEVFNDYVMPNRALANGELDANYFQHVPYLEDQMEANEEYDFVNAGGVHIEPIGVYSQEYATLDELPDGAEILMSDAPSDHGRILLMLEDEGVITLEEGAGTGATLDDIVDNPKNLDFQPNFEAALLPTAYENGEGDAVLINSNFALEANLDPNEDSIAIETSDLDNPYVNIITVRSGDEDNEQIQTLVDVLRSEEVRDFIEEEYNGAVVPAGE